MKLSEAIEGDRLRCEHHRSTWEDYKESINRDFSRRIQFAIITWKVGIQQKDAGGYLFRPIASEDCIKTHEQIQNCICNGNGKWSGVLLG